MRKLCFTALALLVALAVASPAAAFTVDIVGPNAVWVPYGGCTTASWTSSPASLDSYSWTWNSTIVSTSSSYSRTWCSPMKDCATTTSGTLGLYGTSGASGDYDSLWVSVTFEAGTPSGGGCGFQRCCL